MILWLLACNEQGITEIRLDELAVVLGDFDNVGDSLVGLGIAITEYDGFIVQATYEPEDERTQRGEMSLQVEDLLTRFDSTGRIEINNYNAVFLNSGTRGLNAWQYNDAFSADDTLLLDTEAIDNACGFVQTGGVLVVSDWSYDLVEACFPDAVEFAGDDTVIDGAQLGQAGEVLAAVDDADMREAAGSDAISLLYNYSAWAVMEEAGQGTEVLLSGDVQYQPSPSEPVATLTGVPLMVRFQSGQGYVIYSSFHWGAQNPSQTEALLLAAVPGLAEAAGKNTGDSEK